MKHTPFSTRETYSSDSFTVDKFPSMTPEQVIVEDIELDGNFPEEGWEENGPHLTLLRIMAKHGYFMPHPDPEKTDTENMPAKVQAYDIVQVMPYEKYKLRGRMRFSRTQLLLSTQVEGGEESSSPDPSE